MRNIETLRTSLAQTNAPPPSADLVNNAHEDLDRLQVATDAEGRRRQREGLEQLIGVIRTGADTNLLRLRQRSEGILKALEAASRGTAETVLGTTGAGVGSMIDTGLPPLAQSAYSGLTNAVSDWHNAMGRGGWSSVLYAAPFGVTAIGLSWLYKKIRGKQQKMKDPLDPTRDIVRQPPGWRKILALPVLALAGMLGFSAYNNYIRPYVVGEQPQQTNTSNTQQTAQSQPRSNPSNTNNTPTTA